MTRKRLEHFRQRLLQEREALNARILAAQADAQRALGPVEPRDDIPERADLADTSLAMATLLTQQLQEIDDALLRMELGEYGVCELCEEPIELGAWKRDQQRGSVKNTLGVRIRGDRPSSRK